MITIEALEKSARPNKDLRITRLMPRKRFFVMPSGLEYNPFPMKPAGVLLLHWTMCFRSGSTRMETRSNMTGLRLVRMIMAT